MTAENPINALKRIRAACQAAIDAAEDYGPETNKDTVVAILKAIIAECDRGLA